MKRRNFLGFLMGGLIAPIAAFTRPTLLANKKGEISRGKETNLCRRKELAVTLQVPLLGIGHHTRISTICEIGRIKHEN